MLWHKVKMTVEDEYKVTNLRKMKKERRSINKFLKAFSGHVDGVKYQLWWAQMALETNYVSRNSNHMWDETVTEAEKI